MDQRNTLTPRQGQLLVSALPAARLASYAITDRRARRRDRRWRGPGSIAGRGQPVADGRVALEELPLLVVELAPDAVGVHLEVVQLPAVGTTPDVLEDHPAGADLAGVMSEVGEE